MKRHLTVFAALACLALPVFSAPKPVAELPPNVRFIHPTIPNATFCSAVPFRDDWFITVQHSNAAPGLKWKLEWKGKEYAGTITRVQKIIIPGITPGEGIENRSGDVLLVKIEPPLPAEIPRAVIGTADPAGKEVLLTRKDGTRSKRFCATVLVRGQSGFQSIKDGVNPRWCVFTNLNKKDPSQGDSGGGIYFNGKLVSIVSKSAEGTPGGYLYGPNLTSKASRSVLY